MALPQVAYLLVYGELPSAQALSRWDEALMRHSAVPVAVEVRERRLEARLGCSESCISNVLHITFKWGAAAWEVA